MPQSTRAMLFQKGSIVVSITLGLLIFSLSVVKPKFYSSDDHEVYIQTLALAEHGSISLDYFRRDLPPERTLEGTHGLYSKYGIGYPLVATPFLIILKKFGLQKIAGNVKNYKVPCFLFFILSIYCFSEILKLLQYKQKTVQNKSWRRFLIFSYACGTFATYYSVSWPANSFEMSLILIAIWAWLKCESIQMSTSWKWAALCGFTLGWAGVSRGLPFLLAPFFSFTWLRTLYKEFRHSHQLNRHALLKLACFCAPLAICLIFTLWINWYKTGHIGTTYHSTEGFSTPFWIGLTGSLLWPGKAFFFYAPLCLLGVISLPSFIRKYNQVGFLFSGIILFYLISISTWWAWMSGPDVGQRFWLPLVPIFILILVDLSNKWLKTLAFGLTAVGLVLQIFMYFMSPGETWANLVREFPYAETNEQVSNTSGRDLLRAAYQTYFNGAFYRNYKKLP